MKKLVIKYKMSEQICEKAIILPLVGDITDPRELAIDTILSDLGVTVYEWALEEDTND